MIVEFSATELQDIHMRAGDVWRVGGKNGWRVSEVSPEEVLKLYDGIWLKDGYKLVACVYREGLRGRGVVWAVSEEFDEKKIDCPFKPEGAKEVWEVLEGDNSPRSYMSSSMFVREMREFGALWDWMSWGLEEIVEEVGETFEWFEEVDLTPKVIMKEKVEVEFFTLHVLERKVFRNRDVYIRDYHFFSEKEVVAERLV